MAMEDWALTLEGLFVVWYIVYKTYLQGYISILLVDYCEYTSMGILLKYILFYLEYGWGFMVESYCYQFMLWLHNSKYLKYG